ncbi:hypothetical protein ACP4OV_016179 [Aristida adscensionis]
MLAKKENTRMLPKSSSQKTLRAAMREEREQGTPAATAMADRRRLLSSTDASVSNPSFRVYYGVAAAGSVPFVWESAPGTPKNAVADAALPPLTPPPSYYNGKAAAAGKPKLFAKSQSSRRLLSSSKPASFVHSILPKLRRSHTMPSPSSSAAAAKAEGVQCSRRSRLLMVSPRSSFSSASRGDDDEDEGGAAASSPTSTLCFRTRHSGGGTGRLHGLLASMVGGQGSTA